VGGAKGKTLDRYISATGSEIDARFSPQHTPCPSLASAPTRLWLAVTVWGSGPQNRNFTFGDIKRVTFKTFFFEFAYRRAARSSLASEIFEKILNYVFEKIGFEVLGGVVLHTCRATWRKPITSRFRAWLTLVRKKKFWGSTTPRWGDIELQIMQISYPPP